MNLVYSKTLINWKVNEVQAFMTWFFLYFTSIYKEASVYLNSFKGRYIHGS